MSYWKNFDGAPNPTEDAREHTAPVLTVQAVRDTLETFDSSLLVYGSCCTIQRIDNGPAVLNIIAPCFGPDDNKLTVGDMLVALSDVDERNLVYVNGKPAEKVSVEDDGLGLFADIWSGA
jgi:hypothetical protein